MPWQKWCEMCIERRNMDYGERLHEAQFEFARLEPLLNLFAYAIGYTISKGDAYAKTGHKENSLHYDRLAVDINLFKDKRYIEDDEGHKELGAFWESLHPKCCWGGRFNDPNHYSYEFDGRK